MKSVTICITNYQSGDAVALCVESIRKFTAYPHDIAVYDDATNQAKYDDLPYLRGIRDKGWIRLIEGKRRIMHGPALSILLDSCTTDLAMILDCDIQIIAPGWLDDMVGAQEQSKAAIMVDLESYPDNPAVFKSWFFMLDMRQYPYIKAHWDYTTRPDFISWEVTPNAMYPTGYLVYEKAIAQGRPVVPIPRNVFAKYRHPAHISVLSDSLDTSHIAARQGRYSIIQAELRKLRCSP